MAGFEVATEGDAKKLLDIVHSDKPIYHPAHQMRSLNQEKLMCIVGPESSGITTAMYQLVWTCYYIYPDRRELVYAGWVILLAPALFSEGRKNPAWAPVQEVIRQAIRHSGEHHRIVVAVDHLERGIPYGLSGRGGHYLFTFLQSMGASQFPIGTVYQYEGGKNLVVPASTVHVVVSYPDACQSDVLDWFDIPNSYQRLTFDHDSSFNTTVLARYGLHDMEPTYRRKRPNATTPLAQAFAQIPSLPATDDDTSYSAWRDAFRKVSGDERLLLRVLSILDQGGSRAFTATSVQPFHERCGGTPTITSRLFEDLLRKGWLVPANEFPFPGHHSLHTWKSDELTGKAVRLLVAAQSSISYPDGERLAMIEQMRRWLMTAKDIGDRLLLLLAWRYELRSSSASWRELHDALLTEYSKLPNPHRSFFLQGWFEKIVGKTEPGFLDDLQEFAKP